MFLLAIRLYKIQLSNASLFFFPQLYISYFVPKSLTIHRCCDKITKHTQNNFKKAYSNIMAKARKWIINILILLISTVLTLYFVFRRRNFREIIGLLKGANPLPCAAALVLVIVFILSEAFIIRMLAGAAGSKAKIHHCFLYSFTGFFFVVIIFS